MRAGVADGEVLRPQRAAGRRTTAEGHCELDLADRAIRVLGEKHSVRTGTTQRVAHEVELREPPAP